MFKLSTRQFSSRSMWSSECNLVDPATGHGRNVLFQPFFRILTPAADELTGYHLTVTTRDSCSLPLAGPACTIFPPPSSRALAHARPKNRDDFTWWRKRSKNRRRRPAERQDVPRWGDERGVAIIDDVRWTIAEFYVQLFSQLCVYYYLSQLKRANVCETFKEQDNVFSYLVN